MILDKYKLRKEQGTLTLERVGPDVILKELLVNLIKKLHLLI